MKMIKYVKNKQETFTIQINSEEIRLLAMLVSGMVKKYTDEELELLSKEELWELEEIDELKDDIMALHVDKFLESQGPMKKNI